MAVVKQAVHNMDDMEDSFAQLLLKLGAKHSSNVDFSVDNFAVFIESLLATWNCELTDQMTPECTVAWGTLFGYIMLRLQQGFHGGTTER